MTPTITPSITASPDNCANYVFPGDIIMVYCSGDCPPPRLEPEGEGAEGEAGSGECKDTDPLCPRKPDYKCETRIEISIDFTKTCE
jgi:hypothetical protein